MGRDDLAELKHKSDGSIQFRLLSVSLPHIQIDNVNINIEDVIEAIKENPNGGISETPVAKVILQVDKQSLKKDMSPPEILELGGWILKFLYALEGEFPNMPRQYAVHFQLTRSSQK